VGNVIFAVAGWQGKGLLQLACVLGMVLAIFYVIFGGMKEVGWVNVINAIIMYVGILIAVFYIGGNMKGGWAAVNDYYMNVSEGAGGGPGAWWTSALSSGATWRIYIIGTVLSGLFYVAIGPQSTQINASAKNVRAVKTSILIGIPVNTIFGLAMLAFGMASKATLAINPEMAGAIGAGAAAGGPPSATFAFLMLTLPDWLLIWIFACFAAAMLSTMAVQLLALATIIVKDIHVKYFNPTLSEEKQARYTRIWIFATAVVAAAFATLLPPVNNGMTWLFSWLVPAFWLFVIGMFWKRSGTTAFVAMVLSAVGSTIWTYTQPLGFSNSVVGLIIGLVVGIIGTAIDKNAKPGVRHVYLTDRNSIVAEDLRE
jgi:SSS family solute:Na+ symporter